MRRTGFTLIDLMIVIDIIAVCAVMVLPSPRSSQSVSNESNAISVLRDLVRKQVTFNQGCLMDEDQDLRGEYGSFGELSGFANLMRNGVGIPSPLSPPLLFPPFQTISAQGYVRASGYLFVLFLPGNSIPPSGVCDIPGGGPDPWVDPDNCELMWCAYAWPVTAFTTGKRAFFVNESGVVLQTSMEMVVYSGPTVAPLYSAAFTASGMNSPIAVPPFMGVDSNHWTPAP